MTRQTPYLSLALKPRPNYYTRDEAQWIAEVQRDEQRFLGRLVVLGILVTGILVIVWG